MTTQDTIRKWVMLLDRDYLIAQMRTGKGQQTMAKEIGCSKETLREVLKYHRLKRPLILPKK